MKSYVLITFIVLRMFYYKQGTFFVFRFFIYERNIVKNKIFYTVIKCLELYILIRIMKLNCLVRTYKPWITNKLNI